jgi:hypothetical protein
MSKILVLLTCSLLLFIFSCNTQQKEKASFVRIGNKEYKYTKTAELVRDSAVTYEIDSESNNFPRCTQLFEDSEKKYYTFLNKTNNSIYFFNAHDREFLFRIKVPAFNHTDEGNGVDGYYIKNLDSIFFCFRYFLGITDTSGKLKGKFNSYPYQKKKIGSTSILSINSSAQFVIDENYAYVNNTSDLYAHKPKEFKGSQCLFKVNLNDPNDVSYLVEYPDLYHSGAYGANFLGYFSCFNPTLKEIVYGFANDNYIGSYSLQSGSSKFYYAGSERLAEVSPMKTPSAKFEDYNKFYLFSPSYASIIYDKFRNVYYRFALSPISEDDYEKRRWWKKKSIIILDSALAKIGETSISDSCSFMDIYVDQSGLFLNSSTSDKSIEYWRFNLKKLTL